MKKDIEPPRNAPPFDPTALEQAPQSRRSGWRTLGVFVAGATVGGAAVVVVTGGAPPWRELADQAVSWAAAQGLPITAWPSAQPPGRADWADLSETERRAVALSYGYDGPVRDGLFARWLDLSPEKKADFLARYAPPSALRPAPPPASAPIPPPPIQPPPIQPAPIPAAQPPLISPPPAPLPAPPPVAALPPPERGDWSRMSDAERQAAAQFFGYDGPVRDGLFARWLESRPDKKADFAERFLPKPVAPQPPAPPAVQAPERGDWAAMSQAEREATARRFGYAGSVRDGLFARWLESRPDKKADFAKRYLPAPPPQTAVVEPPVTVSTVQPASPPASSPVPSPPAPPPKPAPAPVSSPAPSPSVKSDKTPDARPSKPAASGGGPHYTIRVGSFLDRVNADATAARLSRAGHQAYVSDWTDAKGRTWRVVRVGDYDNAADAQRVIATLERLGLSGQAMRLK